MSLEVPHRVELTAAQKTWARNFWTWVGTTFLNFKTPAIPDMIPRFTPDGRMIYVPAVEPHIHHRNPIGNSIRVDNNPNYNVPQNLVIVSARLHVGKGVRPGDEDEELVIHPDQMHFLWKYGPWKSAGMPKPTPMDELQKERRLSTDLGKPYWNTIYDSHFKEVSSKYLDNYFSDRKEPWPKKKVRGQ